MLIACDKSNYIFSVFRQILTFTSHRHLLHCHIFVFLFLSPMQRDASPIFKFKILNVFGLLAQDTKLKFGRIK